MPTKKIFLATAILLILIIPIAFSQAPAHKEKTETAIILTNSIDYALNSEIFPFLKENNIFPIEANADNFSNYKNEKFILILGGPEAPEGVGKIVQTLLTADEQSFLKSDLNARKMFIKESATQTKLILAGRTRKETQLTVSESEERVIDKIRPISATIALDEIKTTYKDADKATFLNYITFSVSNKGDRTFNPTIDLSIVKSTGEILYENTNIESIDAESRPNTNWWDNVTFPVKFDPGTYNITLKLRKADFPDIIAQNIKTVRVEK